jgi:hypothetical protein
MAVSGRYSPENAGHERERHIAFAPRSRGVCAQQHEIERDGDMAGGSRSTGQSRSPISRSNRSADTDQLPEMSRIGALWMIPGDVEPKSRFPAHVAEQHGVDPDIERFGKSPGAIVTGRLRNEYSSRNKVATGSQWESIPAGTVSTPATAPLPQMFVAR